MPIVPAIVPTTTEQAVEIEAEATDAEVHALQQSIAEATPAAAEPTATVQAEAAIMVEDPCPCR